METLEDFEKLLEKQTDYYYFSNNKCNSLYLNQKLRLNKAYIGFCYGFNNTHKEKFFLGRYHFASTAGLFMAVYNLYNIRQKIIKQSIQLIRSKDPYLIKFTCFYIGGFYLIGLGLLWQIPSISAELAFNVYLGMKHATINYLLHDVEKEMLKKETIDEVKRKFNIKTEIL